MLCDGWNEIKIIDIFIWNVLLIFYLCPRRGAWCSRAFRTALPPALVTNISRLFGGIKSKTPIVLIISITYARKSRICVQTNRNNLKCCTSNESPCMYVMCVVFCCFHRCHRVIIILSVLAHRLSSFKRVYNNNDNNNNNEYTARASSSGSTDRTLRSSYANRN